MAKAGNGNKAITHWTPMHILSGFIMQKKGLTVGQALAASVAFEVAENSIGPKLGLTIPEGANNMTLDMVFNMTGYFLGTKL